VPGGSSEIASRNCWKSTTVLPSIFVMMSPLFTPAFSAGVPARTSEIKAPELLPNCSAKSGLSSCNCTPRNPRATCPVLIRLLGDRAHQIDRGSPADAVGPAVGAVDRGVDPDHRPMAVDQGAPELPWLIGASVWMKSSKDSMLRLLRAQGAHDAAG